MLCTIQFDFEFNFPFSYISKYLSQHPPSDISNSSE